MNSTERDSYGTLGTGNNWGNSASMVPLVFKSDPAATTYKSFRECNENSLYNTMFGSGTTPAGKSWNNTNWNHLSY